jgi:hypothetical protein
MCKFIFQCIPYDGLQESRFMSKRFIHRLIHYFYIYNARPI